MTAQVHDTILFENTIYSICGISGDSLFTPADQGIEPVSTSTACWPGFEASYEISNNQLHLKSSRTTVYRWRIGRDQ